MLIDVLEVIKKFMRDLIRILVKKEELIFEGIKQFYINVEREVICLLNIKMLVRFYFFCISIVLKLQKLGLFFGFCNNVSRVYIRRKVIVLDCKDWGGFFF